MRHTHLVCSTAVFRLSHEFRKRHEFRARHAWSRTLQGS